MIALLLSLLSLAIAPWLYKRLHQHRRLHDVFDRLLISIVVLIILIEVIIESYRHIGWMGPLIGIAGMALPSLIEQAFSRLAMPAHSITAVLGSIALIAHSLMDGATLASAESVWVEVAVVIHQLPLGLAIWWLVQHALGSRIATMTIVAMCVTIVIGYELTTLWMATLNEHSTHILQAFFAGALLHVLIHRHRPHKHHH